VLATLAGFGKMISSIAFGWLSQTHGSHVAIIILGIGLAGTILVSLRWLRKSPHPSIAK